MPMLKDFQDPGRFWATLVTGSSRKCPDASALFLAPGTLHTAFDFASEMETNVHDVLANYVRFSFTLRRRLKPRVLLLPLLRW